VKYSTAKSARAGRVRLTRAGRIYASGTLARLVAHRTVTSGSYVLTIAKPGRVQRIAVRVR